MTFLIVVIEGFSEFEIVWNFGSGLSTSIGLRLRKGNVWISSGIGTIVLNRYYVL